MARGDMAILDMSIDGADGPALDRVNERFQLGIPRVRAWWLFSEPNYSYRERVREALLAKWRERRPAGADQELFSITVGKDL